ncbi:MAG: LacI family transcriptional regulator [Opitutaceae bacterium]|nr:LacI family transcriptional regulator [Opitutaceae bacterium]
MSKNAAYITQRQVAQRAGVHQTTVSLVFRNHPSVPETTRRRVLAAAEALGYRRHPLLAALMSTRLRLAGGDAGSPVLAFLTDFETRDRWKISPTAVEMHDGARARAQELGYRVKVFWLNDPEVPPARLGRILWARNIHGILLAPTHHPRGSLTFDFAPFSVVRLGAGSEHAPITGVMHDHFSGMETALGRCLRAGRWRVGVTLMIGVNKLVSDRWLAAHALACGARGGIARLPAWEGDFEPGRFAGWLKRHRPDALVGTFAGKLPGWLRGRGVAVPGGLALVSLSLSADERFCAGIYQRSRVIGARAVDLLAGALNHNDTGLPSMRQVLQIEGEWRDGPSLAAAAAAAPALTPRSS